MKPPRKRRPRSVIDAIATLIRSRRLQLHWSLAKLAHAAGLRSPAYVFHIENGSKTPREAVARRIASALGLDAELLGAWARARGRADLDGALAASDTVRAWMEQSGNSESRAEHVVARQPSRAETDDDVRPVTTEPDDDSQFLIVPILPEGADPSAAPLEQIAIESLQLPRRLFPPLLAGTRLVGYRLSAHGARRVPELLHPGDCVVVLLGDEAAALDAPCAIRIGGRAELARVRVHGGDVYLPAPAGAPDSAGSGERIGAVERVMIGHVVLAFRRWL